MDDDDGITWDTAHGGRWNVCVARHDDRRRTDPARGSVPPDLQSPVPIGLVPKGMLFNVMDEAPEPLPVGVPANEDSLNPNNWAHYVMNITFYVDRM